MSPVQTIYSFLNHQVDAVDKFVDDVAKSPGTTKKILKVLTKSIKSYDLYTLKKHFPEFQVDGKGVTEFIEVYGLFKDVIYWINPFTNKSIDRKKLTESLDAFLGKYSPVEDLSFTSIEAIEQMVEGTRFSWQEASERLFELNQELMNKYNLSKEIQEQIRRRFANLSKNQSYSKAELLELLGSVVDTVITNCPPQKGQVKKTAAEIVKETLEGEKQHYTREEVLNTLKEKLLENRYSFIGEGVHFEALRKQLTIEQVSRPLIQRIYMVFFTTADFGTVALIFEKWGFVDLAHLSAKIGSQSPIFAFVIKKGADVVLGVVASAGLVLVFGEAVYHTVDQGWLYFNEKDPVLKSIAFKKFMRHLLETISAGTDLASTAAPLIFVVSPQTILILAVVSKGTAVITVFIT